MLRTGKVKAKWYKLARGDAEWVLAFLIGRLVKATPTKVFGEREA